MWEQRSKSKKIRPEDRAVHSLGFQPPLQGWWKRVDEERAMRFAGQHVPHGIVIDDFQRVYNGIAMANTRGRYVDTKLDVSWSTIGISGETTVKAAESALLDWIDEWMVERRWAPIYYAVLEDGSTYGLHSHITLHLEPGFEDLFKLQLGQWLLGFASRPLVYTPEEKTLCLQVGTGSLGDQWNRFKYVMKALSPHAVIEVDGDPDRVIPLAQFAEITWDYKGVINVPRVTWSAVMNQPLIGLDPPVPDTSLRVDGPYLYGDRFLNVWRKSMALEHFTGDLLPRNAHHLIVTRP